MIIRSISTKIISAFAVIVLLASVALILSIRSLDTSRTVQKRLTEHALPLLQASQSLSASVNGYLEALSGMVANSEIHSHDAISRELLKRHSAQIDTSLRTLETFRIDNAELSDIAVLVDQLRDDGKELMAFSLVKKRELHDAIDTVMVRINADLKDMRSQLRRQKILGIARETDQLPYLVDLREALASIDSVLSQYSTTLGSQQIDTLENHFRIALRTISLSLVQLRSSDSKVALAESAKSIFSEIESTQGLFSIAKNINEVNLLLDDLSEQARVSGESINSVLVRLLAIARTEANDEMETFNAVIGKNILAQVVLLCAMLAGSILIALFYIRPKITSRLEVLERDTQKIARRQYNVQIDKSGEDEISRVSQALDAFRLSLIAKDSIEQEREELLEKLSESNEQLQKFAYICSHDLQEPLRTISNFTKLLSQHLKSLTQSDEETERFLNFITQGAKRAQDLIREILDYSKLDSGAMQQDKFHVAELVDVIKSNLAHEISEGVVEVSHDGLVEIQANKTQMYQLFQNLVNNGLKYQVNKHVPHVHISCKDTQDYWQFSIKDNGIGIEDKYKDKVFEIFKRLHSKSEFSGTGIGLAVSKKVVQLHGGKIWFESVLGEGTTFYFTLKKQTTSLDSSANSA